MSEIKLCEMNKTQLISKCKELNITKISNKNKKQMIELIVQKLQNIDVNKVITYVEESSIDYNKYANIIIRAFKKYKNMSMKGYGSRTGLGKWLIIIDDNKTPNPELFWLGNIIGVTDYKLWKDQRENIKNNYSTTTTCLCIYCGVNKKNPNSRKTTQLDFTYWKKIIKISISKTN